MNWIEIEKGLSLSWDTQSDEAKVLLNEDICSLEASEVAATIEKAVGRKCEVNQYNWNSVNEGQNEAINRVEWLELTPAQKFEILSFVEPTAKAFVEEFNEPLDGATTDWDGEAWANDRSKLAFWNNSLNSEFEQAAWDFYSEQLEAATGRLCG